MTIKNILRTEINGLLISTAKIGKDYETLVLDQFGNELKEMHAHYKNDAKGNHFYCVAHFASGRNCIHVI